MPARSRQRVAPVLAALAALAAIALPPGGSAPNHRAHAAVQPAPAAEEVRVTIAGGRTLTGLLVSKDDRGIRLRVDGSELFVPERDLVYVEELRPIEDRYREQRAKLAPGDTEMRMALARWLRDRERYALALIEAEHVLGTSPAHRPARELVAWLRAHLVLENRTRARLAREGEQDQAAQDADAARRAAPRRPPSNVPRLSPEQINLIRVYELDLQDPPRLVVPRPTVERLLTGYPNHPLLPRNDEGRAGLLAARPERQVDVMFRVQARELYSEIRVLEDPGTLATFRSEIHGRWLVRACASNGCHGGAEAGRLRLARRSPNRTDTVYTNFLILDRFRLSNGESLIDFDNPEQSPLLRAGLHPSAVSRVTGREDSWSHPEVPRTRGRRGWNPIFRGPDDTRYEHAVDWIRSLYRPRPEHPIEYDADWLTPPIAPEPTEPPTGPPTEIPASPAGDGPATTPPFGTPRPDPGPEADPDQGGAPPPGS